MLAVKERRGSRITPRRRGFRLWRTMVLSILIVGEWLISYFAGVKKPISLFETFSVSFHSLLHLVTISTASCAISAAFNLLWCWASIGVWEELGKIVDVEEEQDWCQDGALRDALVELLGTSECAIVAYTGLSVVEEAMNPSDKIQRDPFLNHVQQHFLAPHRVVCFAEVEKG